MRPILFITLVLSILCCMHTTRAQDIYYTKEQKFSANASQYSIVGWSGDRLYTYRATKEGYFLDAYNDSMRLLATVSLDFFPQKVRAVQFISYEDQILVFYEAEQNGQIIQYAVRLDSKARMLSRPLGLDSVKIGWFGTAGRNYVITYSVNKEMIMVFALGNKKGQQLSLSTVLLDKTLNIVAKRNVSLDQSGEMSLAQTLLSNEGDLYLTAYTERGFRSGEGNAWLLHLPVKAQAFGEWNIPLGELYVSGLYGKIDNNTGNLYFGSFYSNKKKGNVEGVLYGSYERSSGTFNFLKSIPFSQDLRQATDDRYKKKAFNDYEVRDIVIKNDGGFILIAENFYITSRTAYATGVGGYYSGYAYNSPYANIPVTEYHYGDILAIDYNEQGENQWYKFIRKEQSSQEDAGLFSSYIMLNSGASLVFLFNDFSRNRTSLNLAALDAAGELQLKRLSGGNISTMDWLPRSGKQTDVREFVVPLRSKGSLGFARLAF